MTLMCLDCGERAAYKGGPVCLECGYRYQLRGGGVVPPVDKSEFLSPEPWTAEQYRRYVQ